MTAQQLPGESISHSDVVEVEIVASLQPIVGGRLVVDVVLGRIGQHIVVGEASHVHVRKARSVVDLVSEGTVHLNRNVEVIVTEADVRTQGPFRGGLSCDVAVAAILDVDASVAVEVLDFVAGGPVVLCDKTQAVRQIEHTQRLTDNLIDDVVVAAMETSAIQTCDARHVGRREISAVVIAAQRNELVLLVRHVEVDVELHVALMNGRVADAHLEALVAHSPQVGKHLVEGVGWHRHIVEVKHIARFRMVILDSQHHKIPEEAHVGTDVVRAATLPMQVGIGVGLRCVGHRGCAIPGDKARRIKQGQGIVGRDATQVTRDAHTCT